MISNTTADALLCFVLHEEAHDISFLVVMPQISHRGKRHGSSLTCSTLFCRTSMPSRDSHRPQSSSASRFTAGASGFLNFSQSGERPDR